MCMCMCVCIYLLISNKPTSSFKAFLAIPLRFATNSVNFAFFLQRGPGNSVTPGAADKSIEPVTDPHTGKQFYAQGFIN